MRTINATRYVTPLREGGSLPAVIEADDDGLYVLKFRGAGQGTKALVAELVAGELARVAGLEIPELVYVELDAELARTEPDAEIQALIRASTGLNIGMDFLPGSVTFDPAVDRTDAVLASQIVWFDAFTTNVDRTPRNTNMLVWHRRLTLIDHGAALYFHHDWDSAERSAGNAFPMIRDHVLLPEASAIADADARLASIFDDATIDAVVARIPETWLTTEPTQGSPAQQRDVYATFLKSRLRQRERFVEEAIRAHARNL